MVSIGRTGRATPFAHARAGVRRRLHRRAGDAAQRGRGRAQGRAAGRHGDRAQGRRRDPRGRRAGAGEAAASGARTWKFPTDCPICGSAARPARGRGEPPCINVDCPAQRVQTHRPLREPRRDGHRGPRRRTGVASSSATGLVDDAGDLYSLTLDRLVALERFGAAFARNAPRRDRATRSNGRCGACSSGSASGTSARPRRRRSRAASAASTGSPTRSVEELVACEGVGQIIAESVQRFFGLDRNHDVVEKLRAAGVNFEGPAPAPALEGARRSRV